MLGVASEGGLRVACPSVPSGKGKVTLWQGDVSPYLARGQPLQGSPTACKDAGLKRRL